MKKQKTKAEIKLLISNLIDSKLHTLHQVLPKDVFNSIIEEECLRILKEEEKDVL